MEAYDPDTDTWTKKADIPTGRWGLGSGEIGGRIYAIGGAGDPVPTFSTVEECDPARDTWTSKAPMPTARRDLSVSAAGCRLYAIGGVVSSTGIRTVEEYEILSSPDFNGDEEVDIQDLLRLIQSWGQNDPAVDIAPPPFGDGVVDANDLEVLMSYWGQEILSTALIAHWKLDEAEGSLAFDSVGTSDGVLVGDPLWQPTGGKLGGALQLDGVGDCVTTEFVRDPSEGPFSLSAWVKSGAPGQVIMSQEKGANWLMASASDGALATELKSSGRMAKALKSALTITDGAWHRVGLVWDGSNRILYVDDVEVAKDTQSDLASWTGGLYIGAGSKLSAGTFWTGMIDDVRIYDRAVQP